MPANLSITILIQTAKLCLQKLATITILIQTAKLCLQKLATISIAKKFKLFFPYNGSSFSAVNPNITNGFSKVVYN